MQNHAKNVLFLTIWFSIITFNSIISPRVTIVIETTYNHTIIKMLSVLDIMNPEYQPLNYFCVASLNTPDHVQVHVCIHSKRENHL